MNKLVNVSESTGKATTRTVITARERMLAKQVEYATKNKLHPRAIADYASKYVNLSSSMLNLISRYEEACDFPPGPGREQAMRAVWDASIKYVRSLPLPMISA
jgi:hypothetical protein